MTKKLDRLLEDLLNLTGGPGGLSFEALVKALTERHSARVAAEEAAKIRDEGLIAEWSGEGWTLSSSDDVAPYRAWMAGAVEGDAHLEGAGLVLKQGHTIRGIYTKFHSVLSTGAAPIRNAAFDALAKRAPELLLQRVPLSRLMGMGLVNSQQAYAILEREPMRAAGMPARFWSEGTAQSLRAVGRASEIPRNLATPIELLRYHYRQHDQLTTEEVANGIHQHGRQEYLSEIVAFIDRFAWFPNHFVNLDDGRFLPALCDEMLASGVVPHTVAYSPPTLEYLMPRLLSHGEKLPADFTLEGLSSRTGFENLCHLLAPQYREFSQRFPRMWLEEFADRTRLEDSTLEAMDRAPGILPRRPTLKALNKYFQFPQVKSVKHYVEASFNDLLIAYRSNPQARLCVNGEVPPWVWSTFEQVGAKDLHNLVSEMARRGDPATFINQGTIETWQLMEPWWKYVELYGETNPRYALDCINEAANQEDISMLRPLAVRLVYQNPEWIDQLEKHIKTATFWEDLAKLNPQLASLRPKPMTRIAMDSLSAQDPGEPEFSI